MKNRMDYIRKYPLLISLPIICVINLVLSLITNDGVKFVIWCSVIGLVVHILIVSGLDITKKVEIKTTEDLIEKAWDEYRKEKQMEVDTHGR